MKKILRYIAVAVLCGGGAWVGRADGASFLSSGTSFEAYANGARLDTTKRDDGRAGVPVYWYTSYEHAGYVTNFAALGEYSAACGRPELFNGQSNRRALSVSSEEPLRRTVEGIVDAADADDSYEDVDMGITGIYLDTLVQFSAAEAIPEIASGAKIAVWFYDSEDPTSVFGIRRTLVVTAAGAGGTPTNYFAAVEGVTIKKGEWHRLTVKSIADTGDGVPGFVVFVDGVTATSAGVQSSPRARDAFDEMRLNAIGVKWVEEDALFRSLDATSPRRAQLRYVSLTGAGAVDDLTFVKVGPEWAVDGYYFTLSWEEGLTALTLDGETPQGFEPGAAGSVIVAMDTFSQTFAVNAEYDEARGYERGDWTCTDATGQVVQVTGALFEPNGTSVGLVATRQTNFKIGDEGFETLSEALSTIAGAGSTSVVVRVNAHVSLSAQQNISKSFTLDLAGHTLAYGGAGEADYVLFLSDGFQLGLIDSVGGGVISNANGLAIYTEGDLTIGRTAGDAGAGVAGTVEYGDGAFTIVRGRFDTAHNTADAAFSLADYVAPASQVDDTADGWWTVRPTGVADIATGYFVSSSEANAELAAAFAWATANGLSPSVLAAFAFVDDNYTTNEIAYLLNCAPTAAAIAYEMGLFYVESFDAADPSASTVHTGGDWNGKVEWRHSATVDFTNADVYDKTTYTDASSQYFRAYYVPKNKTDE